jgi:uncharacterized protein
MMEINGDYKFKAPLAKVWQLMMDRAAMEAALPGCEKCEEIAPFSYHVTLALGVATIRGRYNAHITILDPEAPTHFKLFIGGQNGSGTAHGEAFFDLEEHIAGSERHTVVTYKGIAFLSGKLANMGARILSPLGRKMAHDFFKKMDKHMQAEGSKVLEEFQVQSS